MGFCIAVANKTTAGFPSPCFYVEYGVRKEHHKKKSSENWEMERTFSTLS